jgi:pimeloyl-ACP methyl ester carboxylesterase
VKIEINGININYEVHGQGPELILIHGNGGNLTYWEPQVRAFSKKFHVITYDQRGCGESEQPQSGFGFDDFVEELHQLIIKLELAKVYLLGFSQGGAIALLFAAKYPEMVRTLILSNSTTELTAAMSPERKQMVTNMITMLEKEGITQYAEMFANMNFSPGLKERKPMIWHRYYQMLLNARPATLNSIIRTGLESPPPSLDLTKIKCPVLFIQGEYDSMVTPERRERSLESIIGSQLVTLPVGHATAAEAPEEFNQSVLEFLAECEAKKY